MNYKHIFSNSAILLISLFVFTTSSAQVLQKGWSAGLHAGGTKGYTDVTDADINPSAGAGIQYNVSPFTFGTLDYTMGQLSRRELDKYTKRYTNNYQRLTATANMSLGQLLNPEFRVAHYLLYNIYVGSGIGLIRSNISEPNALTFDNFGGITYQGYDLTLPVNVGFNFKVSSYLYPDSPLSFNVNWQHNFTFTEMLDGYDPANSDNKIKDAFSGVSVGMRYHFGNKNRFY